MPKTRQQKEKILQDLNQKIQTAQAVVFCVFNKLSVSEDQALRAELRKEGVAYGVTKKTLLKKSFEENKINGLPEEELLGNISLAASQDEVIGAKILSKFAKNKEDFKIVGGVLNKNWVPAAKVAELAKLPSKVELIAKTVGTIKAPLNGLVNVLAGNMRGLVNVLTAIQEKK